MLPKLVSAITLILLLDPTARAQPLRAAPSSPQPAPPAAVSPSPCRDRWGWFLEATFGGGVGLAADTEGLLRNGGGVIYRPCDDVSVRGGLVLSLWATDKDSDQQHPVFGLYRFGPEIEVDFVRFSGIRLGVAARVDVAFGRAHEGGADLAIHGGVRVRSGGLVIGVDISHGFIPPDPRTHKHDTTVVIGIGESDHLPWVALGVELVAFTIAVNMIHRN